MALYVSRSFKIGEGVFNGHVSSAQHHHVTPEKILICDLTVISHNAN